MYLPRTLIALLVLAVATSWTCATPSSGAKKYNVLLISVDSLRADHLGYNGHSRPTSPVIDRLAAEGVAFETCYSQSGWTLPSMVSILTGRYPSEHGATKFSHRMNESLPTLATILSDHGYSTHAYVSHVFLKPDYGIAAGFRSYDYSVLDVGHPHIVSTAEPLTDLIVRDIDKIREPYFLWVHYFDPHWDYMPHEKWAAFGRSDPGRYDAEIAHTDDQIGRLFDTLRAHNLYENTIVVFIADHGEEFGDHQGKFHYSIYEEVLRVPLIIRAPFLKPGKRQMPAQQIDLLPTILGMLKIDVPEASPGRDLFGDDAQRSQQPIFVERDHPPPFNQNAVILGHYKLSVIDVAESSPTTPEKSLARNVRPGVYLYDLSKGPERQNLYAEDNPTARELLALLAKHRATVGRGTGGGTATIDEDLKEKLRTLGYLQ